MLRSYLFYFGQKDPIKVPILTLSSALVKICQIPHVFFQTTAQNLDNSSVSWKIAPLYFCSSKNIYFGHKEPIFFRKLNFSSVLGWNFVNFKSILKRQVNSSSIFVSFFIVMTHNSTENLKFIHFLFWIKESHQRPNFDTLECSAPFYLHECFFYYSFFLR